MSECIFCKIVKGDAPSHKIWESETHLAFLTIFPNTDGFSVVIPKKHIDSLEFQNIPDEDLISLTLAAKQAAKKIEKAFPSVGRVGLICEGLGVNHLHMKLFPMHGTADMIEWEKIESSKPDEFYESYPGYISSHDSKLADSKYLSKIAEKIRKA